LGSLPFSSGVLAGNTFYLCGHLGLDPATKKIPESVEREVRLMMDGMRDTLALRSDETRRKWQAKVIVRTIAVFFFAGD